ncbi:MAG: HAD-IIIA family hydrolase [Bdellovibrionales bacterium]|nr:HAD-IIIA family hydrolase [Bdellovibrionales bacterium]
MKLNLELIKMLKPIRGVIFDCDGVLTNGQVFYSGNGEWCRFFNIKDGMGIKLLQKQEFKIGIITNSNSEDIRERAKSLGIEDLYEGASDKLACFETLQKKWQLSAHEIAYMGDDYQDIPVFKKAGLAVSVPNAIDPVKEAVHLVTQDSGGMGAVRELCELLLAARSR